MERKEAVTPWTVSSSRRWHAALCCSSCSEHTFLHFKKVKVAKNRVIFFFLLNFTKLSFIRWSYFVKSTWLRLVTLGRHWTSWMWQKSGPFLALIVPLLRKPSLKLWKNKKNVVAAASWCHKGHRCLMSVTRCPSQWLTSDSPLSLFSHPNIRRIQWKICFSWKLKLSIFSWR